MMRITSSTHEFGMQSTANKKMAVEELRLKWKSVMKRNKNTLFRSGFGKLTRVRNKEQNNDNTQSGSLVVVEDENDLMDMIPPEPETEPEVVAIRDTISRNNFERTVGKKKENIVARCNKYGISIVFTK
jgi:hypothetical protein